MSLGLSEIAAAVEELTPSDALELRAESKLRALVAEHGSPLLVLDCSRVQAQFRRLADALPGVDLHYAMKALSHPAVIATLRAEGSFFDISSSGEIELLESAGVSADRVIHTHPIKRDRDIVYALERGCRTFVVDNASELAKFFPYRDDVSLLLRVGFRSSDAAVDLSKKFGCAPDEVFPLLELGKRLKLSITGLSFHVGSQCSTSRAHVAAIAECCEIIERARLAGVAALTVLDIGGGFPAPYRPETLAIEVFCAPIREALARVPAGVRVIAEPGRYIAAPAMDAVASVVGKARRGGVVWYYLDDGVFGSFNGKVYDEGARYPLRAVTSNPGQPQRSVLAGPTCDSIDVIAEDLWLPELELGDLIVADLMGAYTTVSASQFNSIPKAKILVLESPAPRGLRAERPSR